jgi:hypothetical protein
VYAQRITRYRLRLDAIGPAEFVPTKFDMDRNVKWLGSSIVSVWNRILPLQLPSRILLTKRPRDLCMASGISSTSAENQIGGCPNEISYH